MEWAEAPPPGCAAFGFVEAKFHFWYARDMASVFTPTTEVSFRAYRDSADTVRVAIYRRRRPDTDPIQVAERWYIHASDTASRVSAYVVDLQHRAGNSLSTTDLLAQDAIADLMRDLPGIPFSPHPRTPGLFGFITSGAREDYILHSLVKFKDTERSPKHAGAKKVTQTNDPAEGISDTRTE